MTELTNHDAIEAAVSDITRSVGNETLAWNIWNNLNGSPAFIEAFLRLHPARTPVLPFDRETLALTLDRLLPERGNDIRTWPEDEAEAYREERFEAGRRAARALWLQKAADALLEMSLPEGEAAAAAPEGYDAGYQRAIADIRWLADARDEYDSEAVRPNTHTARHIADILEGTNDAFGWLPSWKWDGWDERRNEPVAGA
jgi:hypothetical protein